ncbi:hypothetical protein N9364_00280 [Alphaproteobacteria bacterium]|nr:hypothetical protein [Alphaproteobacteria bacterium]
MKILVNKILLHEYPRIIVIPVILSCIFFLSLTTIFLNSFLYLPRPLLIYENLIILSLVAFLKPLIVTILLFLILLIDCTYHIGKIYYDNFFDVLLEFKYIIYNNAIEQIAYLVLFLLFITLIFFLFSKKLDHKDFKKFSILSSLFLFMLVLLDKLEEKKYLIGPVDEIFNNVPQFDREFANSILWGIYDDFQAFKDIKKNNISLEKKPDIDNFFYKKIPSYFEKTKENKKNVVLIIVESFGYYKDKKIQKFIFQPFKNSKLKENYVVNIGRLKLDEGSTVTAEFRELCGKKNSDYRIKIDFLCAPFIFGEHGYKTYGVHPNTGGFFNRNKWWPKLGFKETIFMPMIKKNNMAICNNSFRALCENELLTSSLERALNSKQPFFYYFLSIEGHLPTRSFKEIDYNKCRVEFNVKRLLCGNIIANKKLLSHLIDKILTLGFKETDFYLVGDHTPNSPYIRNKELFLGRDVFSITIKSRD